MWFIKSIDNNYLYMSEVNRNFTDNSKQNSPLDAIVRAHGIREKFAVSDSFVLSANMRIGRATFANAGTKRVQD